MKTAVLSDTFFQAETMLRHCCLLTDGNSHRPDLATPQRTFVHPDTLCEAMLPEIRSLALLIAAMRHDFNQRSPQVFADESDWFAARILVLHVRAFHLDVRLHPMLQIANQRAQQFAAKHGLLFQAADIRPSLHHKRPANMLLMECDLAGEAHDDMVKNTQAVRAWIAAQ